MSAPQRSSLGNLDEVQDPGTPTLTYSYTSMSTWANSHWQADRDKSLAECKQGKGERGPQLRSLIPGKYGADFQNKRSQLRPIICYTFRRKAPLWLGVPTLWVVEKATFANGEHNGEQYVPYSARTLKRPASYFLDMGCSSDARCSFTNMYG